MNVTSTAAADDGDPAGTGARTVKISGLNSTWDAIEETVTLNGITIVQTNATFIRVYRAEVMTAGSGGTNAGVIYIYTGTETSGVPDTATLIYASIEIGEGQTLQAAYTVPDDHTAYLFSLNASSFSNTSVSLTVRLKARKGGGLTNEPFVTKDRFVITRGSFGIDHSDYPIAFAARTDLKVTADSSGAAADCSAQMEIILVNNTVAWP